MGVAVVLSKPCLCKLRCEDGFTLEGDISYVIYPTELLSHVSFGKFAMS